MSIPYIGFGNDTLNELPKVHEGDKIHCPICGKKHILECGTKNGEKTDILLFYKCGDKIFLGAVAGRLTINTKADISGSI